MSRLTRLATLAAAALALALPAGLAATTASAATGKGAPRKKKPDINLRGAVPLRPGQRVPLECQPVQSGRGGLAAFSGGRLTIYKGTRYGFSGYFTTSPLIMTGAGSVTEADAGALDSTADGFSTYLVP